MLLCIEDIHKGSAMAAAKIPNWHTFCLRSGWFFHTSEGCAAYGGEIYRWVGKRVLFS